MGNIFWEKNKSFRKSVQYTSSLLSIQYLSNATFGSPPKSLKNIFYFLGGVNLFIAGFSYFYKSDYEVMKETLSIRPIVNFQKEKLAGASLNLSF